MGKDERDPEQAEDELEHRIEAKRFEVQKILVDWLGQVEVDREGVISFPVDSTRVFIRVITFNESTVISIEAPTNLEVPATPEVFRHVATHADEWIFGHLSCTEEDDKVTIVFSHRLQGDYLQPEEVKGAVGAVAFTATQIDQQMYQQFGGRLFGAPEEEDPSVGSLSPDATTVAQVSGQALPLAAHQAGAEPLPSEDETAGYL